MKTSSFISGVAAAACALGVALAPRAAATISDEDFNALRSMVTNQDQRIGQLEKLHEQDQQTHQQDQQTIQQLEQRLGETQTLATNAVSLATNAVEKADAVALAQATPLRNALHNFTMVGDAEVQFGQAKGQSGAFSLADFAPIFLFRANDNILFEAGFDVTLQNGSASGTNVVTSAPYTHDASSSTTVSLSFAQLDYLLNDYVTVVAGYMIMPLGTYQERGAGWLNKIPDDPLAIDFLPASGAGVQLRGAVPVGESGQMLTYSVYGVNGPSSVDGSANSFTLDSGGNRMPNLDLSGNVGVTSGGNNANLNNNPSGGGRIGWFYPWQAHYDLELNVSGQTGTWAGNYLWSALVVDAAVHISPYVEVKGEYINTWQQTADAGNIQPTGWWVQAGYKLAGLDLDAPVVNDLELVGRYDTANDAMGSTTDRTTAGFVYYLTNTLLLEGDYEWLSNRGLNANGLPSSLFIVQLSYGF
ncbi:MAG: hypothetical protein ACLP2Y_09925 [Limisphaerales bacterium]